MSTDVSSPPQRFSVLTLLLVYLAFMFFGVVLVGVIYMVADQFLTKSSSNASMGFLIPMLAAMAMTSFWAKREGRPTSGRQWLVALLAALLTLALNGALIWYLATSGAVPELAFNGAPSRDDLSFGAILAAVLFALLALIIRGGFWLGFNGWEKQQKKLRDKMRPPRG